MSSNQTDIKLTKAPEGATQAPAEYFTGTARIKTLVPPNEQTDCVVSDVTFQAGARNNWHTHPNGQILVVTAGAGYYQEQGKDIQLLRVGDAVNIAPDVVHWHGALADSAFVHIAINPNVSKGGAVMFDYLNLILCVSYHRFLILN